MDNSIGVGILVGLTFASTVFILKSDYFTKPQKMVLGILFVFPPAQWVLAIILGIWNKNNNISIGFNIDKTKNSIKDLENFKKQGILTEEEFELKTNQLIAKKQNEFFEKSDEYKSLKKLRNENILTEQEFREKAELLKTKILTEVEESDSKEPEELTKIPTQKKEFKIATGRIDKTEFRKKFIYLVILFVISIAISFLPYFDLLLLLSWTLTIFLFGYSIYLIKPAARRLQDIEINSLWSLLFIYPLFGLIFGIYLSLKDGKNIEKGIE
ncbi:DUF805 domain-containing protein [Maribacter sp. 2304DJ31-5]|uniref:DUF805 domain-containing protein n=1 Tax=Maribacter sp. 2304DJ31-5 TaxID=3386273 RepID=UPI0039BC4D86